MSHSMLPAFNLFEELDNLEYSSYIGDENCNSSFGTGLDYRPIQKSTDPFLGETGVEESLELVGLGQTDFDNFVSSPFDYPLESCIKNIQYYSLSRDSETLHSLGDFELKLNDLGLLNELESPDVNLESSSDFEFHNTIVNLEGFKLPSSFSIPTVPSNVHNLSVANESKFEKGKYSLNSNLDLNWNSCDPNLFSNIDIVSPKGKIDDNINFAKPLEVSKNSNLDKFIGIKVSSTVQAPSLPIGLNDHFESRPCSRNDTEKLGLQENLKTDLNPKYKNIFQQSLLPCRIVVNTTKINKPIQTRLSVNSEMVAPFEVPLVTCSMVKIPGEEICGNQPKKLASVEKVGFGLQHCEEPANYIHTSQSSPTSIDNPSHSKIKNCILLRSQKAKLCKSKKIKTQDQSEKSSKVAINKLPFTSFKQKRSLFNNFKSTNRGKKVKAYELAPLSDPSMERCRRNAINAKRNRELKKCRLMELEQKVQMEKKENEKLAGENRALKFEKLELETQLNNFTGILEDPKQLALLLQKYKDKSMNRSEILSHINETFENAFGS